MPPILISDTGDIILRPAKPGDGAAYLALGKSAEIHRMFGGDRRRPPDASRKNAAWWLRSLRREQAAWVIEHKRRLIGQIRLHSISQNDRKARLSVGILTEDQLGKGIGRRTIRLVLAHAFGEMGLNRVDLRVLALNERAIRCYLACGFVEEGRERQSALIDGEYYDDLMMSILAAEIAR